ncbi:hypothetical protein [Nocardia nova]|uniref:hypothetical protein n=1 Tax=Nocardia nova TaxID=37330 RepID=UPI00056E87EF|nr:hypothetical protein [Nocardia nova]
MAGLLGIVVILGICILIVGMVFIGVTLARRPGKQPDTPALPMYPEALPMYPEPGAQRNGLAHSARQQQTQWPQRPYDR